MSIPYNKLPWIASRKNVRGNARVQMDVIGKILTVHFVTIMRIHFVVQIMLHIKAIVNSIRLNVKALDYMELNLQVILCQKHSFLHQLISKYDNKLFIELPAQHMICTKLVLSLKFSSTRTSKNNFLSYFELNNWCKNECFWQKIICTVQYNHVVPCQKDCEDIVANYSYSYGNNVDDYVNQLWQC